MSFPKVVLINPKFSHNLGAAIRACSCFAVDELLYTGSRIDISEFSRLPREERMKGYRDVRWRHNDFPLDGRGTPVCVEVLEKSEPLTHFNHPPDAVYVFGPEDGSVPKSLRVACHRFVHIPAHHCLNLAAAINVVLFHRSMQRVFDGRFPSPSVGSIESRGRAELSAMERVGWDGK